MNRMEIFTLSALTLIWVVFIIAVAPTALQLVRELELPGPGAAPLLGLDDEPMVPGFPEDLEDQINTYSGMYGLTRRDLDAGNERSTVEFRRRYNSADTRTGMMGIGWMHRYEVRVRSPGDRTPDLLVVRSSGQTDRHTFNLDGSFTPPPAVRTQLTRNRDTTYAATLPDGRIFSFNGKGDPTAIQDPSGGRVSIAYNGANQATAISDQRGGTLALSYHPESALLARVEDEWGTGVSYDYDELGRLVSVQDTQGRREVYRYDGTSQRIAERIDGAGHVVLRLEYDSAGRVVRRQRELDILREAGTDFFYEERTDGSQVTTHILPPLADGWRPVIVDRYDARHYVVEHIERYTPDPSQDRVQRWTYDANGFRE